jgi:hypothetical protein
MRVRSLHRREIRKLGEPMESMPLQLGTAGAATPGSVTLNYNILAGSRPPCRGSRQKHGRK